MASSKNDYLQRQQSQEPRPRINTISRENINEIQVTTSLK